MRPPWPRAAAALTCSSSVHTHRAIRRTSLRRSRVPSSGILTAPYATQPDPYAEFDAAHQHGPSPIQLQTPAWAPSYVTPEPPIRAPPRDFTRENAARPWGPRGALHALDSICDTPEALARHVQSRRQHKPFLRELHRSYDPLGRLGFGWHHAYLGPSLVAIQLAVDDEQRLDSLPKREPMSTLQFEKYHNMVLELVRDLVIQAYHDECPGEPDRARRNVESLDSAWTAMRLLRSEGYPRYNHPMTDPNATQKSRDELADKIRTLFDTWGTGNFNTRAKFQVAKMCYNMLVCPVPPSMHHYNLLLWGFTQKAYYHLADIVATSFFEDSRLRPTVMTVICLLYHYRRKQDIQSFYNVIRRMLAIDNRGMLIRRRWYEDVVKIPELHQWARQSEVTTSLRANWVIERPALGPDIYEALVSGLLSFDRTKDAVKVFVGSLDEGMGVSTELFIFLLKQCRYMVDASAAMILARGLLDHANLIIALLFREDCPARLVEHLYLTLNIGDAPGFEFSEARAQMILASRIMRVDKRDTGNARRLKTAMFIRQTEHYLDKLEKRLRAFRAPWRVRGHRQGTMLVVQRCIAALGTLDRYLGRLSAQLLKHQTLQVLVRELELCTWNPRPGHMAYLHKRVVVTLQKHVPIPSGYDVVYGGYSDAERLEMIVSLADRWMHYRLMKLYGAKSRARRLLMRIELVLETGRRMMAECVQVLGAPVYFGPGTVEDSEPVIQVQDGEISTEEGSVWPKAETAATWARRPLVRRVYLTDGQSAQHAREERRWRPSRRRTGRSKVLDAGSGSAVTGD